MKKSITKWMAISLVFVLVLVGFAGCTKENGEGELPLEQTSLGKGRFMEQMLSMPEEAAYIQGFNQLSDGSYLVIGNKDKEMMLSDWFVWSSKDNGATWVEEDLPWLEELKNTVVMTADFTSKTEGYVYYQDMPDDVMAQIEALYTEEKYEEAEVLMEELYRFAKITPNGLETLSNKLPHDESGMSPESIVVKSEQEVLVNCYYSLYLLNAKAGEKSFSVETEMGDTIGAGAGVFTKDKIAVVINGVISFYNPETGEVEKEIIVSETKKEEPEGTVMMSYGMQSTEALYYRAKDDSLYYVNKSGIYHILYENEVIEKVVDGSLNSLSLPTTSIDNLFLNEDGSFLVLGTNDNGDKHLYSYKYDATVSTQPSKELKIFTLRSFQNIQQAIGAYQLKNPDVKVTQTIGVTGEEGVTEADALKTLSTEILAGKAPDIIVLDGIPIDSYIEKGILADLSDLLSADIASGKYITNIAESFKTDKGIFAVPTRFSTYAILGEDIENVNNISDFVGWYKAHSETNLGIYTDELIKLYPLITKDWFNEDGTLNNEELKNGLDMLEEFDTEIGSLPEDSFSGTNDFFTGPLLWANNKTGLFIGEIQSIERSLPVAFGAIKQRNGEIVGEGRMRIQTGPAGEVIESFEELEELEKIVTEETTDGVEKGSGAFDIFPENDSIYLPKAILGVYAETKQMELAKDFLSFTLSTETQKNDFEDGLPINIEALNNSIVVKNIEDNIRGYALSYMPDEDDPDGQPEDYSLSYGDAKEEEQKPLIEKMQALDRGITQNAAVEQMIRAELEEMLITKSQSKEETYENIVSKLEIYLAE